MATQTASIDVDAPPDQVWKLVGDFHGIGSWFPGIESSRSEGDARILDMMGMEVREELVERDEASHRISYRIASGVPVDRHQATISVTPKGGGSHIEWLVDVEPDTMAPVMADVYQKALQAIDEHLS